MKRFLFMVLALFLLIIPQTYAQDGVTGAIFESPTINGGPADTNKQTVSVTDSGDANPATANLEITAGYVEITCADAHTCDITLLEATSVEGDRAIIVNIGTNVVDFADQANVLNISGATALGADDTLSLIYTGALWVETSQVDN